jgi:hypothetical protein
MSIALVLSAAVVALLSMDSTTSAQRNRTYLYDSGVVRMGPNQSLIGLLVPGLQTNINNEAAFRSTKMQYAEVSCSGTICRDAATSEFSTGWDILQVNQSVRDEVTQAPTSSGVRIVFSSNTPNLEAKGEVIDTVSGAVVSTFSFGASQTGN